ncbi:transposase [Kitasatospora sp. NPDC050463]|uniref:transposase n=1 Tax=Kitasatospora sp. NPDC050463 TaxID=3155786 RepID=UPI0033C70F63
MSSWVLRGARGSSSGTRSRWWSPAGGASPSGARELGVSPEPLRQWAQRSRAAAGTPGAGGGGPVTAAEREELRRLRRQVRELELEKEILRKAAA